MAQLRRQLPNLRISLHQGSLIRVARMLLDETADIGLATESLAQIPELVSLPCYEWQHVMVVPRDHPLAEAPLHHARAIGHPAPGHLPRQLHRPHAHRPRLCLARAHAGDRAGGHRPDVLKTYVRLGMGVGLVAEMAMREEPPNSELVWRLLGQLLGQNVTRVAFKRGAYFAQLRLQLCRDAVRTGSAASSSSAP